MTKNPDGQVVIRMSHSDPPDELSARRRQAATAARSQGRSPEQELSDAHGGLLDAARQFALLPAGARRELTEARVLALYNAAGAYMLAENFFENVHWLALMATGEVGTEHAPVALESLLTLLLGQGWLNAVDYQRIHEAICRPGVTASAASDSAVVRHVMSIAGQLESLRAQLARLPSEVESLPAEAPPLLAQAVAAMQQFQVNLNQLARSMGAPVPPPPRGDDEP